MAEIAKSGTPSLSSLKLGSDDKISGLIAGEDIAAGDACYIKASDGKIWRASGAAATAPARVRGFCQVDAKAGQACTIAWGCRMRYGATLTPGTDYYLSGTVLGGLADAASTGGTQPIAFAVDATRIQIFDIR